MFDPSSEVDFRKHSQPSESNAPARLAECLYPNQPSREFSVAPSQIVKLNSNRRHSEVPRFHQRDEESQTAGNFQTQIEPLRKILS
jgi:hypothetical protein